VVSVGGNFQEAGGTKGTPVEPSMFLFHAFLVGWFSLVFHILGIIIPTDFHIFQRGRSTTNQINYKVLPATLRTVFGETTASPSSTAGKRKPKVAISQPLAI
jgi:hypothetical protein